jgi:membrane protease YdiL (CAAX protease family)
MHLREAEETLTDVMHIILTIVNVLFILLTIGFGATADGKWFRLYSIGTILVLVLCGAWAFLDSPRIAANLPTPWIGVRERINIYGYMLWMMVLAIVLLRVQQVERPQDDLGRSRESLARKEGIMTTINAFIKKHPVLAYFTLTFIISWGGFLLVGGPGILAGANWQTDPLFPFAVLAMLAGPPIAGILLTVLVSGKAGLRELLSRLLRWRAGARWYAVALLAAPLLSATVLFALSLFSPEFLPAIVTSDDKASLLLLGIAVGLGGGFVEELGWTGFAIPRLRLRYGVLATGLIVGVIWGAWHLLQMWWVGGASSEALPLTLFLPQYFFSAIAQLTAYRVLMVWVYDRTESLLVATLMHAGLIASTLFILAPPTTGAPFLTYSWVFAAVLWVVVAVVAVASRGQLSRKPLRRRVA